MGIGGAKNVKKEFVPSEKAGPTTKSELDELYSYSSAMCKITCKIFDNK